MCSADNARGSISIDRQKPIFQSMKRSTRLACTATARNNKSVGTVSSSRNSSSPRHRKPLTLYLPTYPHYPHKSGEIGARISRHARIYIHRCARDLNFTRRRAAAAAAFAPPPVTHATPRSSSPPVVDVVVPPIIPAPSLTATRAKNSRMCGGGGIVAA